MPGLGHRRAKARRSSNGYGIHVLLFGSKKDVDGRNKSGHDGKAVPTLSAHPVESGVPAVTRISVLSGCRIAPQRWIPAFAGMSGVWCTLTAGMRGQIAALTLPSVLQILSPITARKTGRKAGR